MSSGTSTPAPAAPLIGRASEVEDVLGLLGRARIVTLTGPPGVGKTRLAQAICAERDDLAVVWVDLAPVREPRQVRAELARALAPGESGDRDRLLVLDNCEHLLDVDPDLGSEVVALLSSSPRLQVLATSRERLRLAAEREYAVPPLPMPSADDAADPARLRDNPAVRLLLDRAPPAVRLTPNTARALAEICIDLDGLPLAIELAAARLRVFTPSELAFRLGRRMSVLTSGPRDSPDRHRDLRAAIAWSHDLLSERDRAAFRRLSVFPGEWDLESAESVCGVPDFIDVLESLLDKSLVRRAGADLDGAARFTMLMSLREYAAEQLEEQGEGREARDRHSAWFARRGRDWEESIGTLRETESLPQLAAFHADLEAAIVHARAVRLDDHVVWLAAALGWFGYTHGVSAEQPLDDLVAVVDAAVAEPEAVSAARLAAGVVAYGLGRLDLAQSQLDPLRGDDGSADRRTTVARAFLGHLARERGDVAEAAALYTAARTAHVQVGNSRGIAWAGHDLALLALDEDRTDEADELLAESIGLFDEIGFDWAVARCTALQAAAVVRRGGTDDVDRAAGLLGRALQLHDRVGDRRGIAQCLEGMAEVAVGRGAAATAARLLGAADAGRRRAAALPTESEVRHLADLDRRLDTTLGRAAAEHERHAGRTMPPPAVLELALRMVEGATAGATAVELTVRQLEVAALVAAGHTNRQIGRLLGISEKTTEVHVHNLMTRLETPSRPGVAAWAAARGLTAEPSTP